MRTHHAIVLAGALLVGCTGEVGKPTDQEVQQMNAWAEVVTPKDRAEVTRQVNQHTDWLERKKVQWITGEYKKRYTHQQTKLAATTHPATGPATQPGFGGF